MASSPLNIRLSTDALAALKILKHASPDKSQSDLVCESLIRAAKKHAAAPILQFARLDPGEYLGIYAVIAEVAQQHQRLKKDLLKIRPADIAAAEKLTEVIAKAGAEISALLELRQRLGKIARATADIAPDDATMLREQVAPVCRQDIADPKASDFIIRKSCAILNLIRTVFPDVEND